MSTTPDPLAGALDDAESAGASYEVPVDLVRARVRRRRRARAAARGAVALTAVAAVVVAVPWVLGGSGRGTVVAQGDWPGQFTRCGASAAEVTAPEGLVTLTLQAAADRVGGDRTWFGATAASVDPAVATEGWVVGSGVSLLRDGVVVAVQDGAQVLLPEQVELAAPADVVAFPVVSDVATLLASCASYPSGDGDGVVPAGTYDVVVTQTVAWSDAGGAVRTDRATATSSVVVADDPGPADDPTACGGDASGLAAIAGPEANPFAVTLDADVPPTAAAGSDVRFTVTATNEGTTAVAGWTGHPGVLLTHDGRVVGTPGASDDIGLDATMTPGASIGYDAWTPLHDCATLGVGEHASTSGGDPLPPGDYEAWVAMEMFLTEPAGSDGPEGDRTDVRLVYGPWPLTLE